MAGVLPAIIIFGTVMHVPMGHPEIMKRPGEIRRMGGATRNPSRLFVQVIQFYWDFFAPSRARLSFPNTLIAHERYALVDCTALPEFLGLDAII